MSVSRDGQVGMNARMIAASRFSHFLQWKRTSQLLDMCSIIGDVFWLSCRVLPRPAIYRIWGVGVENLTHTLIWGSLSSSFLVPPQLSDLGFIVFPPPGLHRD